MPTTRCSTQRALILHVQPDATAKSHRSVLSTFSLLCVKTGMVPEEWGTRINRAQTARAVADYGEDGIGADEAKTYLDGARELVSIVREIVPPDQRPPVLTVEPRTLLQDEHEAEAVTRALAEALCGLMEERGEVLPLAMREELVLYGNEADLTHLIVKIDEMQDLGSFLTSRISIPSLD